MGASPLLPREAIREARPQLRALAGELGAPERPSARGVALAQRLLVDEGSALYAPSEPDALGRAVEEARAGVRRAGATR